jgi:trimethylamine:corrinoid methyltransferase-like protein
MELMVLQNEYACRAARQLRGIDCSPKTDFTDELIAAGPGSAFIGSKNTRRMVRAGVELYSSRLFPDTLRTTYDETARMREIANRYIHEILEEPPEDALPEDVQRRIDEICAEADTALA